MTNLRRASAQSPKTPKKSSNKRPSLDNGIIIASIALIGTVIAALISFRGSPGYVFTLQSTQTAQAKNAALTALPQNMTSPTSLEPTDILISTPTPLTMFEVPTLTSTITPSNGPTPLSIDLPSTCLSQERALSEVSQFLPTPIPNPDNYLVPHSNFENWIYNANTGWQATSWSVSFGSNVQYIVPDNRDPKEGFYSVCIQAGRINDPASFSHLTQGLPPEPLRLTFFYKTNGTPDVRVLLTTEGSYDGDFHTPNGLTSEKPPPLDISNSWSEKSIDFIIDKNIRSCPKMLEYLVEWGCFHVMFVVVGEGTVWVDDVRVEKSQQ